MVWGFLRVSIFTTAFFIGLILAGPGDPVSSAAISVPQVEEKTGTALVVSCDAGIITMTQVQKDESVQFKCAEGNMVVIRDHSGSLEDIPELRLLRYQISF